MTTEILSTITGARTPQKSLTCALCLEVYTSPRLLPCHHTFCLHCLEGLASAHGGKSFPCPSCRKPTPVPPKEGVQAFQTNFYITEEELERARSGADSAMCLQHSVEPLVFLCQDCDKAICIRCKLTDHENHKTEDLPKAAARCKDQLNQARERLQGTIERLESKVKEGQDNLKAAQAKAEIVREQVCAQHDTIVANADRWRQAVLADLAKVKASLEEQLNNDIRLVQQELDSLVQLRRRLDLTMEDPGDAELVDFEREMRTGDGSEEELERIENKVPTTTARLGLHSDITTITRVDICRFLGRPVKLVTPIVTIPTEEVTPYVRCGQELSRREVHALCVLDDSTMHVTYGGAWWDYTDDSWLCVTKRQREIPIDIGLKGRVTFKKYDKDKFFHTASISDDGREVILNAKSKPMYQLHYAQSLPAAVKKVKVTWDCPVEVEEKVDVTLNMSRPFAFDVSSDGEIFAVLEEEISEEPVEQKVLGQASALRPTLAQGSPAQSPSSQKVPEKSGEQAANSMQLPEKVDLAKLAVVEQIERMKQSRKTGEKTPKKEQDTTSNRSSATNPTDEKTNQKETSDGTEQKKTTESVNTEMAAADESSDSTASNSKVQRNFKTEIFRNIKRVVCLYRRSHATPIATYAAPTLPTDLCFWGSGEEERLIVTDWLNDSVHVTQVTSDGCRFERYFAAGCSDIVRPTALATDCKGCLWIGCSTGWVLKCQKLLLDREKIGDIPEEEETHSDVDDDVELLDA